MSGCAQLCSRAFAGLSSAVWLPTWAWLTLPSLAVVNESAGLSWLGCVGWGLLAEPSWVCLGWLYMVAWTGCAGSVCWADLGWLGWAALALLSLAGQNWPGWAVLAGLCSLPLSLSLSAVMVRPCWACLGWLRWAALTQLGRLRRHYSPDPNENRDVANAKHTNRENNLNRTTNFEKMSKSAQIDHKRRNGSLKRAKERPGGAPKCQKGSQKGPKGAQRSQKGSQKGSKGAPREPQGAKKAPRRPPGGSRRSPRGAPKWSQDATWGGLNLCVFTSIQKKKRCFLMCLC